LQQESEEIKRLKQDLDVDINVVNIWNFEKTADKYYQDPDYLFIFDTDLGEILEENVFAYRINVNYALCKKNDDEKYRVWFYTVAGPDFEKDVKRVFINHVLEAHLKEEQLDLKLRECDTFFQQITTDKRVAAGDSVS
jgi:hypothetical protein